MAFQHLAATRNEPAIQTKRDSYIHTNSRGGQKTKMTKRKQVIGQQRAPFTDNCTGTRLQGLGRAVRDGKRNRLSGGGVYEARNGVGIPTAAPNEED